MGPEGEVLLEEGQSAGCLPEQSLYYGLWRSCYSGAESIQSSCYSDVQNTTATSSATVKTGIYSTSEDVKSDLCFF